MNEVVIRYRVYLWGGIFLFVLCCAAALLPGRDQTSMVLLGVLMLLIFAAISSQKVVFSEEGITSCFLWMKSRQHWSDVIQAGVARVADHGNQGAHLLLTFTGGVVKTPSMGFRDWTNRNPQTCLYVPDSPELRDMVRRCYGDLDFIRD